MLILVFLDNDMILMPPHNSNFSLADMALKNQIGKHLSTRLSIERTATTAAIPVSRATVLRYLPDEAERWGKVRFMPEGDTIHAYNVVTMADDGRDASYARVRPILTSSLQ